MAPIASSRRTASDADRTSRSAQAWSAMGADELRRELEAGLRRILARELRVAETELDVDLPFAELGLNSVMSMSIRREAEQLAGIELSTTMLWNHPTIESLTTFLVEKLSPQQDSDSDIDVVSDSTSSVLDTLFDSVESAP
jgi:phthiocerol/phenolphthiocerol synthesis type-I polyketide synthase A